MGGKSGRKNQPAEPLLASLEIQLRQVISGATSALHLLRISKGNYATLTSDFVSCSAVEALSDSQVLSKNLLETIQLVGTKAHAIITTAERVLIAPKESEKSERADKQGANRTTSSSGPSIQTVRRRNLRTAQKAKEKSEEADKEKTKSATPAALKRVHNASARQIPRTSSGNESQTPQTPWQPIPDTSSEPKSIGQKRAKNSTGDRGNRKEPKARRSILRDKSNQSNRSVSHPVAASPREGSMTRASSLSPEGRETFKVEYG